MSKIIYKKDDNVYTNNVIQKAYLSDIETENLLLNLPSTDSSCFLSDYLESINNTALENNYIWRIKKKSNTRIIGNIYFFNRNIDLNFAFIYCDIFNENITVKETVKFTHEAILGVIQFLTEEMKIERLFYPLYNREKDDYNIERLGFEKCTDRNKYTQKYPHDIFMYTS